HRRAPTVAGAFGTSSGRRGAVRRDRDRPAPGFRLSRGRRPGSGQPAESRPLTGYVDIHAHVLPGIDDGPSALADSIALARAAAGAGTATIAATPHVRSDFPRVRVHELAERCAEVREALAREQVAIELVAGAEV